jgi:predicted RNase H-like HicB family nuclease
MLRKKVAAREVTVVFEPDGGGWHVFVPQVQGCRSHGRSIAEARRNIREALALCSEDAPEIARFAGTIVFAEEVRVPSAARRAVDRALKAREAALRTDAEASKTAAEGAKALRRAGLSLRDAGELLHLSHQRIKQLTQA